MHDERRAVFSVIDGLAFEFRPRLQRDGEMIDDFLISSLALKNPGCFPDDVYRIVSGEFLKGSICVDDFTASRGVGDKD